LKIKIKPTKLKRREKENIELDRKKKISKKLKYHKRMMTAFSKVKRNRML
jgi:hypothetical protein